MTKKSKTKKTFHVRITDEWTDDEKATVYSIMFVRREGEDIIGIQNLIKKGKHEALLLGKSVNGLYQWQRNNPRDTYPETYNEIYDDEKKEWVRMLSMTELMEMKLFG